MEFLHHPQQLDKSSPSLFYRYQYLISILVKKTWKNPAKVYMKECKWNSHNEPPKI